MHEKKVTLLNRTGEKLVGLETVHTGDKRPAIILVHGFGVTKEEYFHMFNHLTYALYHQRFIVFRFDFSGCGESEGTFAETSLPKMATEVQSILTYVKKHPLVDKKRIGILGQSFGACAVITAQPKVTCILFTGSVAQPERRMVKSFRNDYHPDGLSTRIRSNGKKTIVGPSFWKGFKNLNMLTLVKTLHCPLLFIYGKDDITVPQEQTNLLYKQARPPKEKISLPGDHNYRGHEKELHNAVTAWFTRHLL